MAVNFGRDKLAWSAKIWRDIEKRFKRRVSRSANTRVSRQANITDIESVDFVVNMIGDSLRTVFGKPSSDEPITLNEIDLTLNVAAVHDEGGHLKFSALGLEGDIGGSHRTDDTHAIKISFQPEDLNGTADASSESAQHPSTLGPGNELFESFQELKAIIDADRQQAHPRNATVILNFVVQEDLSISLVAAGQAETSTTHSISLRFDRPSTKSP